MLNKKEIVFDKAGYNLEAIQKAAYKGMNIFTLRLEQSEEQFLCTLIANMGIEGVDFSHGIEEFEKDVLDYTLRSKLKAETEDFRNLIIGIAFSKTNFIDNE